MPNTFPTSRLLGLDVARAFAIAGMALIHFAMVLSSNPDHGSSLSWMIDRLAGRPASIFMILAGIGVSLRFRNVDDEAKRSGIRRSLAKRGVFFLIVGFINLIVWSGDILRVYGLAYLMAAALALTCSRKLLVAAMLVMMTYVVMVFSIDFETNWDFETLEYANLWTWRGGTMNLFYNGFRTVFPWTALLFVGMGIGRLDLGSKEVRYRLIYLGLVLWVVAESVSYLTLRVFGSQVSEADRESLIAVFGTDSLPAMPLFLLSSSGLAIATIMFCVEACERIHEFWYRPFAAAGQLAFTWYIGHIIVVIAVGVATNYQSDTPMPTTLCVAALFVVTMVTVSAFYRRYFRYGPLEWVLRRIAS